MRQESPVSLRHLAAGELTDNMIHDEGSGFHYKFEYDRNNLYLKLAAEDPVLVSKIAYFGLTVWIDRAGERNKDQGFRFPVPARVAGRPAGGSGTQAGVTARRAQEGMAANRPGEGSARILPEKPGALLERAEEIELIGIYGSASRTVKIWDSRIRVSVAMVEDLLVYEAVIPFEMLQRGFDPFTAGGQWTVGLETGHYEPPAQPRQVQPRGGSPSGGIGQPGRMPGQYPGQYPSQYPMADRARIDARGGEMAAFSRPSRLWMKLEFAR
ncbi:MAG: hypothetical protein EA408_02010 [Marinilabiliales bacterium]|nr:MAG: hypothetical protein EA408_02010 [Marinilabiliales bacterium]